MAELARIAVFIAAVACAAWPQASVAQDLGCHLVESGAGPARQTLHCRSGVTIEAEQQAEVHLVDQAGKGKPDGVRLESGAVLLDVPPNYSGGFKVLAPRAVAAVRGTSWIVDVGDDVTSVFVIRGRVGVHRTSENGGVTLGKGDGVDVDDSSTPLHVNRWRPPRAAALLARFGR